MLFQNYQVRWDRSSGGLLKRCVEHGQPNRGAQLPLHVLYVIARELQPLLLPLQSLSNRQLPPQRLLVPIEGWYVACACGHDWKMRGLFASWED
jgi:hypothetical protein